MSKAIMTAGVLLVWWIMPSFSARPYVTDDAGTVERGSFELESASNYWKKSVDLGIDLKHGLTERVDIGVAFGYTAMPASLAQFSGLALNMKYALIPELLSATASGTLGDPSYAANLILSKTISNISLHANLGLEAIQAASHADLTYGILATVRKGVVEGGMELVGTQEGLNFWQVGLQVAVTDWLAIDGGLGGDFTHGESLVATTGIWYMF